MAQISLSLPACLQAGHFLLFSLSKINSLPKTIQLSPAHHTIAKQ
jgi:hypothetical protein